MRIAIITFGTRGDVQPLLALGLGLQQAGHEVSIATSTEYEAFVKSYGLKYFPLGANLRSLLHSSAGRSVMDPGRNLVKSLKNLKYIAQVLLEPVMNGSWAACQQADAAIYAAVATFAPADHIRDVLDIPCYHAKIQPSLVPMDNFAHPVFPPAPRLLLDGSKAASAYNRLTFLLMQQLFWLPLRSGLNRWRRETLQLPPLPIRGPFGTYHRQKMPGLHGFSRFVVPKPLDWPDWQHVTGYWFLDRPPTWQPPSDLGDFMAAGPPPLGITFGSSLVRNSENLAGIISKTLARTGQRAVWLAGWGGVNKAALSPNVYVAASLPYDWLFPRLSAVVHHGGAGTTAAALRAGIPSVTIPIFADHPFWSRRIAALGVGPKPIPRRRLTVSRLVAAIQTALEDRKMRAMAAHYGQIIRAENGIERAVDAFHRHL